MTTTPFHFGFNIIIYYIITLIFSIEFLIINCFYLLLAELIDLDHLFSKPIYHPKRNPFKIHYFHKNWKFVLVIGILGLFFYPIIFFGLGLISHLLIDYIYTKYYLKL